MIPVRSIVARDKHLIFHNILFTLFRGDGCGSCLMPEFNISFGLLIYRVGFRYRMMFFKKVSSTEEGQNSVDCFGCSPSVQEFGTEAKSENNLVPQRTRFLGRCNFTWTQNLIIISFCAETIIDSLRFQTASLSFLLTHLLSPRLFPPNEAVQTTAD